VSALVSRKLVPEVVAIGELLPSRRIEYTTPAEPPLSIDAVQLMFGRFVGLAAATLVGISGGVLSKMVRCTGVAMLWLPAASTARTA
jgi:hypothetical protein